MPDPDPPAFVDRTLVTPIVLDDAQGRWTFDPIFDISPYEAALLSQLFVAMTLRRQRLHWREYLTRSRPIVPGVRMFCDLARHFIKEDHA